MRLYKKPHPFSFNMFILNKYVFNMANINKIKLSGQTYDIQDPNASKTVELTQAQYDALSVKDPNTFYIITDATGGDLSNYYTKSETSGATQISTALADKLDVTAYTPTDLSNYYTKTETDTALSGKQDTLSAGTGIDITDNVISATGGGGGMDDNTQQLIATSLVDLNDRKADKSLLGDYQKKGDYATKSELATKANASDVMTLEKSTNNELVTASALNSLNNKFGGLSLVKMSESEYSALTTKDENVLYIVVADPS